MHFKKSFCVTLIAFLFVTINYSNAADNYGYMPNDLFEENTQEKSNDTSARKASTKEEKKEEFKLDGVVHVRPLSASYFISLTGLRQCFFEYRLDNETNTKIYQIHVSIVWEGLDLKLRFFKSLPGQKDTTSLAATGDACEVNTAILPKVEITKCKMRGVKDEEVCKDAVKVDWRPAPFSD